MNRNKRSLALNLKSPAAIELIYELIPHIDVVTENYRPGVMERLGLGYEKLAAINPGLVYASGSGYGSSGPYVTRPGQDLIIQGISGMAANTGRAGDLPTPLGTAIVDASTAVMLALHIMIALYHRQATGQGQKVETSLFNTAISMQCQELAAFTNLGLRWERSEAGIAQAWLEAPYGVYPTQDGPITIAMNPLAKLSELLDMPVLLEYDDAEKAFAHRDEIMHMIAGVTATYRRDDLLAKLLGADIWCGPVQDFEDLVCDPQVQHNEMFVEVESPRAGTLKLVGHPGKLSATPASVRFPPPQVGEHTDAVLREFGLGDARIAELRRQGVIG
jgi:crotonobetainyl-CoA:carnitine CoA-transferase CaiB-like acyl-CoA transferase